MTWSLEKEARKELAKFCKERWMLNKEFHWQQWPLRRDHWVVLIKAAKSSKIGCKGGLVNELGRSTTSEWVLSAVAVLQKEGMLEGFTPTELGWKMIEHFRTDEDIEPTPTKQKAQRSSFGGFRRGGRCR